MSKKRSPSGPTSAATGSSLRAGRTDSGSPDPLPKGQSLYQRAEKISRQRAGSAQPDLAALSPDEAARLLHDLHVHQIELELQNEELRRLQSELDASREHYFELYDLAPVGYCALDQTGRIMEANLSTATLLHVDRDLLIRQPLGRFVLQEDQGIYRTHLQNLFATGEFQSFELRMRREDDTVFWLHLNANLARDSTTAPACRLILSDISRLKKAEEVLQKSSEGRFRKLMEESLRESENCYRQLFESASDALFLIAPDSCQIIKANTKASELYSYNQEELLTKKCVDLSTEPDETFHLFQTMQPFPAQSARVPLRLHRKKDGTIFPVEITAREFPFNGRPLILAVIRDISERVEAEKENARLEAMNWQLQKRESLKRMAGAIAHNFNNRLGVVIGNLEMMIDDLPRQTGPRYILTAALEAAQKAAETGGLLLTYLGQSTGRFAPLDLSEICRSNLPLLQAAVPKTIATSFDLPVPGPVINGNIHQLQQVINNLITNACEASLDKKAP